MGKTLTRFFVLLKNNICKKSFCIYVFLMFLLCFALYKYNNYAGLADNLCGIYLEENDAFNCELRDELLRKESFALYDNYDSMIKDINAGKLCCGFVLDDSIENFDPHDYEGYTVNYISTSRIQESETYKELFFDCFLKEYNDILIPYFGSEIFEKMDKEREKELINLKNQYLNSDKLFSVSIEYINSEDIGSIKNVYPMKGMIAVCIFLAALFTGLSFYENERKVIISSFLHSERIRIKLLYLFSLVLPVATVGVIAQLIFEHDRMSEILIRLLALIIYSIAWTLLLQKITKSKKLYSAIVFVIILLMFFVCPIVFNAEQYIPAIRYIKYLIPVSVYL